MTVVFGVGVGVGVGVGIGLGGCGCGYGCGFERYEWSGGCLGFEEGSRHVGMVADVVVLIVVVLFLVLVVLVVVIVVVLAGGAEERGGLGGVRGRSLFSTRLLRGVRGCFCIHPFVDYAGTVMGVRYFME